MAVLHKEWQRQTAQGMTKLSFAVWLDEWILVAHSD